MSGLSGHYALRAKLLTCECPEYGKATPIKVACNQDMTKTPGAYNTVASRPCSGRRTQDVQGSSGIRIGRWLYKALKDYAHYPLAVDKTKSTGNT
jgi:hypothetical protein